jgi:heptosyltransferase-1
MRVLLIKTSSMGDLIHTLPALTDAKRALPDISFDWVVEDVFADIPRWHPAVNNIIPVALRRWRKGVFSKETMAEWRQLRQRLNENHYDLILDAQGLVKSAFLGFFTSGLRAGLDWKSARESLASLMYQRKYRVNFHQHAIIRMRTLFSLALGYVLPETMPDYGLSGALGLGGKLRDDHERVAGILPVNDDRMAANSSPYLVFLFGTTWTSKQWPELYWRQLAELTHQAGYQVKVSGYNKQEFEQAAGIAVNNPGVEVLPRLGIAGMGELLAGATAVVAVDTGFGHLAAALNVPTISIYGPTNPEYTGAIGRSSSHLAADFPCAPCLSRECTYRKPSAVTPACYATVSPQRVWAAVAEKLNLGECSSPVLVRLSPGSVNG